MSIRIEENARLLLLEARKNANPSRHRRRPFLCADLIARNPHGVFRLVFIIVAALAAQLRAGPAAPAGTRLAKVRYSNNRK